MFLGPWVFPAMFLQFFVNVIVVTLAVSECCQKVSEETRPEKEDENTGEPLSVVLTTEPEEAGMEMISTGASSSQQEAKALTVDQGEKPEKESKPFYKLKAALTSLWLPAVVGDKKNLFIAASISTLISKILMLLVSVVLAYFFQEKIHPHPFILWSRVGKSQDS